MLNSQGSRPDFRCGQGVKHENLLGQDLDRGRGWKYRRLCSVPPLTWEALHGLLLFGDLSVMVVNGVDNATYCMSIEIGDFNSAHYIE